MRDVIFMPTYNERENVGVIIPEIFRLEPDIYVVIVDDNSPDGTADVVRELMKQYQNLSLHQRKQKEGLGAAYIDGFKTVLGDSSVRSIITMDADGSHDPGKLSQMRQKIHNYDVVIGSRYIRGGGISNWNVIRRLVSFCGNLYTRLFARIGVHDMTSGFMCIRRELLVAADLSFVGASGFSFLIELKYLLIKRHRASFLEIPIIFKERERGQPKFSSKIFLEGALVPPKMLLKNKLQKIQHA